MGAMLDLRSAARAHLPEVPAIEALYPAARATWRGRMVNEFTSAKVFEGTAKQILDAGLDPALARECHGFAAEERRHGVLCGAVVEAVGGEALAPFPERDPFPFHEDASPLEGLLRNLISISCCSETVAVALVGAERLEMPDGELRELLTSIYADEVGHARFGWGLVAQEVPKLDAATRDRLSRYLALALGHLEAHELAHLPADRRAPVGGEVLGLCDGGDARTLLYETIHEVIVPGLQKLGLEAERAWRSRPRGALH